MGARLGQPHLPPSWPKATGTVYTKPCAAGRFGSQHRRAPGCPERGTQITPLAVVWGSDTPPDTRVYTSEYRLQNGDLCVHGAHTARTARRGLDRVFTHTDANMPTRSVARA